jgi:hypothetical protein
MALSLRWRWTNCTTALGDLFAFASSDIGTGSRDARAHRQSTLWCRLLQSRNYLGRIKAEDFPKLHEFHDINAPVAAFEPGDEGLIFAQAGCKLGLRHFQGVAPGDQEVDQRPVPL